MSDTPSSEGAGTEIGALEVGAPPAAETWLDAIPEDIRAQGNLKDFKSVADLAKSYVHTKKLVGADRSNFLTLPAEDAPQEERDAFYQKLGRPDTPDAYTLPTDKVPEGVARSEDMEKWYKETAHKLGLTSQQAAGMYEQYVSFAAQMMEGSTQSLEKLRDDGMQQIKQEWGAATDRNLGQAQSALRKFADDDLVSMLETTGLGSHPAMVKTWHKVAQAIGEDRLQDRSQTEPVMTPAEAQAEIARLQSDSTFVKAWTTRNHPGHDVAVRKMDNLTRYVTAGAVR